MFSSINEFLLWSAPVGLFSASNKTKTPIWTGYVLPNTPALWLCNTEGQHCMNALSTVDEADTSSATSRCIWKSRAKLQLLFFNANFSSSPKSSCNFFAICQLKKNKLTFPLRFLAMLVSLSQGKYYLKLLSRWMETYLMWINWNSPVIHFTP